MHTPQKQIACGHVRRWTNREIGEALKCSETTAKWHLYSVRQKLAVTDRMEATRVAMERGSLDIE